MAKKTAPSTTKYAYEKLLNEHKLSISDLPADARIGINGINKIQAAINMQEKKAEKNGKTYTPSADVVANIKAYDKWVVREILDFVDEKNTNTEEPEVSAEEIVEDIKEEAAPDKEPAKTGNTAQPIADDDDSSMFNADGTPKKTEEPKPADPRGQQIDQEFSEMVKSNKTEVSLDELKSLAPTAYDDVFKNYEKGGENGVDTTFYSLREVGKKFILTKK